jgi:hypothetical protein
MSFLTLLSMVMHPVIAIIVAVIFNESTFYAIRTGLIAAIKYTGGNVTLPILEKFSYALYMAAPMFSPYAEEISDVEGSMRVASGQWKYLLFTGGYALTIAALTYLLTLAALKRKNFV